MELRLFINGNNEQIILMDILMERIFINEKKRTVKKKINSLTLLKRDLALSIISNMASVADEKGEKANDVIGGHRARSATDVIVRRHQSRTQTTGK